MITDPLDRLRASDPVPHGSSAPPVERLLERIRSEGRAQRRWPGWSGALVPALGTAAAIAVVAVALILVRGHHHGVARRSVPGATSRGPSSAPVAPAGGMRGLVFLYGAAFASPSDGIISLQQCLGCRNGNPTAHTSYLTWLASTTDGGASWRVTRRPWYVFDPRLSGPDGWAEGLQAQSNGGGEARFYVTHDYGRDWSVAPSAAAALGDQNVSIGGGEVWAIGSNCAAQCTVTVMHAPVTGSRLVATPTQPVSGGGTNVEAVAAGPHSAYVTDPNAAGQNFVTHDDGRTWQRIVRPCPRTDVGDLADGRSPGSLWVTCTARRATTLRASTDGGRSWHTPAGRYTNVFGLQPVSAQVAWGLTPHGAVVRTTDGGSTWRTVWSVGHSQPPSLRSRAPMFAALSSNTPMLTAQSASSASVVMILTRGRVGKQAMFTNLVVYRTRDGGATWHPSVLPLPGR